MALGDTFLSDIDAQFASGGAGLIPGQGRSNLPDALRTLLGLHHIAVPTTATLTAGLAKNRKDGMLCVVLASYSIWVWQAASVVAASATVIAPTDVGAGAGRWVQKVA